MRFLSGLAATSAALLSVASALNPIQIQEQEFVDSVTQARFDIIGVDYQPGGSSGFTGNGDPLSDSNACLRDAALMQQMGINTVRVYNLDPLANHDQCVSIFYSVGIYLILDVNSPFDGGSINADNPGDSYNTEYVNRTFLMIDAFRGYPNVIGFFGANELINSDDNAKPNAPYIRAVQRDMHQYIAARGGRQTYVGYSAAQVQDVLVSTSNYLQCAINGDNNDDSRSDWFGLNSYSWCGDSSFQTAGYDMLVEWFQNTTVPVFFSEYGCNKVQPRQFTEIPVIYGPQMASFSGGLIYQWTQDSNDYGIVQVNPDGSAKLLGDYATIKTQLGKVDNATITTKNNSATSLQPARCDPSLIPNPSFSTDWDLPKQPDGVSDLIKAGVGGPQGKLVDITTTQVPQQVQDANGQPIQGLAIVKTNNPNAPGAAGSTTSSSSSSSKSKGAAPGLALPEMGTTLSAILACVAFVGFA